MPNPSFEDTLVCPSTLDQLDASLGWVSYRSSPDYFNSCSNIVNVPNATWGFQNAHSGNAFVGIATYRININPNDSTYREIIGINLTSPLQIGTKYYCSFYAVRSDSILTGYASNNLGLRFFSNSYSKTNPVPIDNISHMAYSSMLSDSVNWTRISGSFIADSSYSYVSIGNFYDDFSTTVISNYTNPIAAAYYIDDICVTTDSLYNETWTGLQNIELNEIHIWPNPIQNYFQFSAKQKIDEVTIYDSRGMLIKSENVNALEGRIEFDELSAGVYFAVFRRESDVSVHKFLKF